MNDISIEESRKEAYRQMALFAENRREYYDGKSPSSPTLDKLLSKDVIMFAGRGVKDADQFVEEAFRAIESSSEETVIGNTWQRLIANIAKDTIDAGDLVTVRDGILWCCELKSQPNTVNSSSKPQELRALKDKVEDKLHTARPTHQPVKAAFCVMRSKKPIDITVTYQSGPYDRPNADLDGFEYRYLAGEAFWKWLMGIPGPEFLINEPSAIETKDVVAKRKACIVRLTEQMHEELAENGLGNTIDDVLELKKIKLLGE